ncbi:MAG: DNA alkylation repair protein [Bacteroidota bacterium]
MLEDGPQWTIEDIQNQLEVLADKEFLRQYQRFGIEARGGRGVRTPEIKSLAKEVGQSYDMALALWDKPIHEMKLLAIRVMPAKQLTEDIIRKWSHDIYSWDLCDSACLHLFRRVPFAHDQSFQLAHEDGLFVRRVGLVLMTALVIHNKSISQVAIEDYLGVAKKYSKDERPLIKKAVSWLLRQIGKSSSARMAMVLPIAEEMATSVEKPERWIGKDVLRELRRR